MRGSEDMRRRRWCAVWLLVMACSPGGDSGTTTVVETDTPTVNPDVPNNGGSAGSGAAPNLNNPGGDLFGNDLACPGGCAFTEEPLLDEGVSSGDIAPFAASAEFQAGSLCVLEPQLSTAQL